MLPCLTLTLDPYFIMLSGAIKGKDVGPLLHLHAVAI